jgi:GH35 family endo-1,4-beta-xylanase
MTNQGTKFLIRSLSILLFMLSNLHYGIAQDISLVEQEILAKAEANIEKYRKGDVAIQFKSADEKSLINAKIEILQESHDFLFGCIIFDLTRNESIYREEQFKSQFKKIFNLAVFPFYWPGYEQQQGMPGWERLMPALDWCKANGITTKGHPLVWACKSGVPGWLEGYSVSETISLSNARVSNIVRGFRDQIEIWDVVNEPVNVKTWTNKVSNIDDENDWNVQDPIPEVADYVEDALHWAFAANPEAQLIINEFNTIALTEVRDRFNALLKELQDRNAPISGIGIQAHEPRQEWYSPEEVWKTFDLYAQYGHPIHITELHPQSAGKKITGNWRTGTWNEDTQEEFTEQFVKLCFGHPAVASINWWGFSDRSIWLPGGGLVDEEYRPKKVYTMLDNLINREWNTKVQRVLDEEGKLSFRGFYGEYSVKLTTAKGRVFSFPIHVRESEENKWVFKVK